MSDRWIAFVDDEESASLVTRRFGDVTCISTKRVGPGVLRWRRATLEADVDALAAAHRRRPYRGVLFWREPWVLVGTRVAERLGLPRAIDDPTLARDKLRMKEALRPAVRCPASTLVRTNADLEAAAPDGFPAVLKPRWGFASLCAVRVDDLASARRELAEKADKLATTHLEEVDLGIPAAPELVLESFVGGTEHTVESFVADGEVVLQIVSDKLPMEPPHFVEVGDVMPSRLPPADCERLTQAAKRGIAALGIRSGWTHAEIKLWRGEAWVMEIAARMGGGYTRELVEAVFGLDMLGAMFDFAERGEIPRLGSPRAVAHGRRVMARGVRFVWSAPVDELPAHVRRVARESKGRRRGVFLGAPFSYDGTLAAYVLSGADDRQVEALGADLVRALSPRSLEIPIPRAFYRAYLRAKRRMEGLWR